MNARYSRTHSSVGYTNVSGYFYFNCLFTNIIGNKTGYRLRVKDLDMPFHIHQILIFIRDFHHNRINFRVSIYLGIYNEKYRQIKRKINTKDWKGVLVDRVYTLSNS